MNLNDFSDFPTLVLVTSGHFWAQLLPQLLPKLLMSNSKVHICFNFAPRIRNAGLSRGTKYQAECLGIVTLCCNVKSSKVSLGIFT